MRIKYIFVTFILNILLLIVVSSYLELLSLEFKAQQIRNYMRTAADMAFQEIQTTDDFFTNQTDLANSGYNVGAGDGAFEMTFSSTSDFVKKPLYQALFNTDQKNLIFNKLYVTNSDFHTFSNTVANIDIPVRYYTDETKSSMSWYTISKLSEMGLSMVGVGLNTGDAYGVRVGANWTSKLETDFLIDYGFDGPIKYAKDAGGTHQFFYTPLSLGVSYLNKDILSSLYINNMDLLMRVKYTKAGGNLNDPKTGGQGVYTGSTYASKLTTASATIAAQNPINNGVFTLLRGAKLLTSDPGVNLYEGVRKPDIDYKVIDMYNSANDDILTYIFGATNNADTLKEKDKNIINPATGSIFTKKLFVVAKVTFYADTIVPLETPFIRDFRANLDSTTNNYVNLSNTATSKIGASGNSLMEYTTYFAVTP